MGKFQQGGQRTNDMRWIWLMRDDICTFLAGVSIFWDVYGTSCVGLDGSGRKDADAADSCWQRWTISQASASIEIGECSTREDSHFDTTCERNVSLMSKRTVHGRYRHMLEPNFMFCHCIVYLTSLAHTLSPYLSTSRSSRSVTFPSPPRTMKLDPASA